MIALFTLLTLLALGATLDDAVSAARLALDRRRARRACVWRPRRPDPRFLPLNFTRR